MPPISELFSDPLDPEICERARRNRRPDWVQEMPNGWRIVDGIFLEEFAEEEGLLFIHGKFYDGDRERSEEELRAKIQRLIKPYCATNLSNRTKSLLDGLKSECYFEPPAPAWNEIHCKNCTIQITEAGKIRLLEPSFSLYRASVEYNQSAPTPENFLKFLRELLYEEDIPVLQEYLGYILLPTNKAQKMATLTGRGGEGKSRLGAVLSAILKSVMVTGSVAKLQENRFLFSTLENRLLFFDDDLRTEKLKDTDLIKSLVTAETEMLAERKGKDFYAMHSYAKLLILGNQNVSALFDKSDGFYRRQLLMTCRPKRKDRVDDPFLTQKLLAELPGIFAWMVEGARRLVEHRFVFTPSERITANINQIRYEENTPMAFLEDRGYVRYGPGLCATSQELYNQYVLWCERNAAAAVAKRTFLQVLSDSQEQLNIKRTNKLQEKGRVRGYYGVQVVDQYPNGGRILIKDRG